MTTITLAPKSSIAGSGSSQALVIGLAQSDKGLVLETGTAQIDEADLLEALQDLGATGKSDEVIKLPGTTSKLLVITGLGKQHARGAYPHEVLRRAAGAAARALAGVESAAFALPCVKLPAVAAIAEGALLGAYTFDDFRGSTKKERKAPLASVTILSPLAGTAPARKVIARASAIADAVHLTRNLINMPPSHLTPISFVDHIRPLAKKAGVKVEVLDEVALRKGGYGGIIGVGQGSANPPRLLRLTYTPTRSKAHHAYIGKGITFDTGGIALKPAAGMEAMKSDMSGAAAVCAAIIAIAELKIPITIDAWAALAENMPSDTAQRPSDVLTTYGGRTVEVLNPDAEGRLVLADAMMRAQELGNKGTKRLDAMVDVATLTGAQEVALGKRTSAIMGNDEVLTEAFLAAAEEAGEAFWPMPLPEELRASLDSPVADIANIGDRFGGMLTAGLFLKEFVQEDQPWAHLDIAGPAFNTAAPHGYTPIGGTGVAVSTLIRLAEASSGR